MKSKVSPRSRQHRQTRLNFTPLPSSSPNRSRRSPLQPDSPSPVKKRKVGEEEHQAEPPALPTPGKSSLQRNQIYEPFTTHQPAIYGDSEDEPSTTGSLHTSRQQPKRQAKLNWSGGRDYEAAASGVNLSPPVMARSTPGGGIFQGTSLAHRTADFGSDSDSSECKLSRHSPCRPRRLQSKRVGSSALNASSGHQDNNGYELINISSDSLPEAGECSTSRATRRLARRSHTKEGDDASGELGESHLQRRTTRSFARNARRVVAVSSNSDEEAAKSSEGVEKAGQSRLDIGEPESSGNELLCSVGRRPRKKPQPLSDDDEGAAVLGSRRKLSQLGVTICDYEASPISGRKRKQAISASNMISDEDDEDDSDPITPCRRGARISKNERYGDTDDNDSDGAMGRKSSGSRQERQDLDEDLEFLGSSSAPQPVTESRWRGYAIGKRSARQKALDTLKRRRAGGRARPEPQSTDSDGDIEGSEDDLDGEQYATDPPQVYDMFQNDDDNDFVVSDADEPLGAPSGVPLEFSHWSRAKPKDLFRFAIEWMVQKKINPAFQINDSLYQLAFRKLGDEVNGLVGSKFKSSVWTPQFLRSLEARPGIEATEMAPAERALALDRCDACNRGRHPPSWNIRFTGKPYHKDTLEEVEWDEDEEDEVDDGNTFDSQGRSVPDSDVVYGVGQHCRRNAETAHALAHWRYNLNAWVVDYLEEEGEFTSSKLVERNEWSTKRKGEYALQLVEEMMQRGQIRTLYVLYRDALKNAREVKNDGRWD